MNNPRHIPGWTLVETLVVMIIAGVVFGALMDGMLLFGRYAQRKSAEITGNMELYEGYSRLRHMTATSDSIAADGTLITLYRRGEAFVLLTETDSLLTARTGSMNDTLMSGVSELRIHESVARTDADSLCLRVSIPEGGSLDFSFPVRIPPERRAMEILEEQEKQYAYEEYEQE